MSAAARGWTACSVPVVLWVAHLTSLAALSNPVCDRPGLSWIPHALTVGLALACVPFLVVSARLVQAGGPTDETETRSDLHFLGWLGLGLGAASVLLIVAEGLFVVGVDPCL